MRPPIGLAATTWALVATSVVLAATIGFLFVAWIRGRLTVDLGWGRSSIPLGPIVVPVAADRETVFQVLASPYAARPSREARAGVEVLERGRDMVIAVHHTRLRWFTSDTTEAVRFEPPARISFRLLRGPVPHVVEAFELEAVRDGTEVRYGGELAMDLWLPGRVAGRIVARVWVRVVGRHLEEAKRHAEERAEARRRRGA